MVSGIDDSDTVRDFSSVWVLARCGKWGDDLGTSAARFSAATSTDCERLAAFAALAAAAAAADSDLFDSEVKDARCWDKIDRFSSIGVKILWDFL